MKHLQKIVFILAIVFFFVECSKNEDSSTTGGNTSDKEEITISDKEKILELVNNQRVKGCNCGELYMPPVKPLTWNDLLEKAAQIHSDDMSKHKFLSHSGSDKSDPGDRISRVGYKWKTYGENVISSASTPEEAISRWLKSGGHCQNIMSEKFIEIGVATKNGYWTMVFAR